MTDESAKAKLETRYLGYIRDLAYILREEIVVAARQKTLTGSEFEDGREFGLREALAWMQHKADSFEISKEDVMLSGFDALTESVELPPLDRRDKGF